jgi:hypothetical protein
MKRKLSAKDLLSSIHSGLTYRELRERYGITEEQLDKVRDKLITARLIGEETFPGKNSTFTCPKCNHPQDLGLVECLHCGVIFAKVGTTKSEVKETAEPVDSKASSEPETTAEHRVLEGKNETKAIRVPHPAFFVGIGLILMWAILIGLWLFGEATDDPVAWFFGFASLIVGFILCVIFYNVRPEWSVVHTSMTRYQIVQFVVGSVALMVVGAAVTPLLVTTRCSLSGPSVVGAWAAAQMEVRLRLKSPSTAQFPHYSPSFVSETGKGQYTVRSYVDAQNSFGATIRTRFLCVLSHVAGVSYECERFAFY